MQEAGRGRSPSAGTGPLPRPPSERPQHLFGLVVGLVALGVLVAVLSGAFAGSQAARAPRADPPALAAATPTPAPTPTAGEGQPGVPPVDPGSAQQGGAASGKVPAAPPATATAASATAATAKAATATASAASAGRGSGHRQAIVAHPSAAQQQVELATLPGRTVTHIPRRWMEGFYPIYEEAQSTFGVNWLLIASIHRQESAFSTAKSTYHGLNFAHCCGGPMQFNVTNRPVPTWDLVKDSYVYAKRPPHYDHATAKHPSIYDDFDSIMAAAHLLSADGAGYQLDGSAWNAAYDYYGHDYAGVTYADEVLARAIGWSQHGFCINCGVEPSMVSSVYAAYGAPVRAALEREERARKKAKRERERHRREQARERERHRHEQARELERHGHEQTGEPEPAKHGAKAKTQGG